MKKISLIFLLIIVCFIVCGCDNATKEKSDQDITGTTTVTKKIVPSDFDKNGTGMLKCTTEAYAGDGVDVDLRYTLKYKDGNIFELVSVQKVISDMTDSLDLYEEAYLAIAGNYNGLDHYDTSVVRDNNSVTYTTIINYDKINITKLLDIEGEEDNVVKNGKAKLSLWLDLAGKVGTICEEV